MLALPENLFPPLCCGHDSRSRLVGAKRRPVHPHPMQDDSEFASQQHFRLLHTGAAGELHRSALEARPFHQPRQYDVGGFVKRRAHAGVADLGDPATQVRLAGLVLSGRQTEMRPDAL